MPFTPATVKLSLTLLGKVVNYCKSKQVLPYFEAYPGESGEVEIVMHYRDKAVAFIVQGAFHKFCCTHTLGESKQVSDADIAAAYLCT